MPNERSFVTFKRSYAFWKQRQKACKFQASLSYIEDSRPASAAQQAPVSKILKLN